MSEDRKQRCPAWQQSKPGVNPSPCSEQGSWAQLLTADAGREVKCKQCLASPFLLTQEVLSSAASNCLPSSPLCFETSPSGAQLPLFSSIWELVGCSQMEEISFNFIYEISYFIYEEWSIVHEQLSLVSCPPLCCVSSSHRRRLQMPWVGDHWIYQQARFGQKIVRKGHKATSGAEVGAVSWSGENMRGGRATLPCGEPDIRLLPGDHSQGTMHRTSLCLVSLALILCFFL